MFDSEVTEQSCVFLQEHKKSKGHTIIGCLYSFTFDILHPVCFNALIMHCEAYSE